MSFIMVFSSVMKCVPSNGCISSRQLIASVAVLICHIG